MFSADFALFSIAGGILIAGLLWLSGVQEQERLRANRKESALVEEAIRIVDPHEARRPR